MNLREPNETPIVPTESAVSTSGRPMSGRPTSNVRLLGWVSFWSGMAQEMVYPLLPMFVVVALTASRASLGAVEGLLAVGVTIARLVTGRRVDHGDSPRRLTRISYAISLISRPLMALANSVPMVGVLRVADGFGKGARTPRVMSSSPPTPRSPPPGARSGCSACSTPSARSPGRSRSRWCCS